MRVLFALIVVFAVVSFGLGMACGIRAFMLYCTPKMVAINKLVIAWLVTQVAVDGFITATLTTILARSRPTLSKSKTNGIINRLIRGAI